MVYGEAAGRKISSPVRRLWCYEISGVDSLRLAGSLIQACWGIWGGVGRRPKRSGWRAYAAARVTALLSLRRGVVGVWGGV